MVSASAVLGEVKGKLSTTRPVQSTASIDSNGLATVSSDVQQSIYDVAGQGDSVKIIEAIVNSVVDQVNIELASMKAIYNAHIHVAPPGTAGGPTSSAVGPMPS